MIKCEGMFGNDGCGKFFTPSPEAKHAAEFDFYLGYTKAVEIIPICDDCNDVVNTHRGIK